MEESVLVEHVLDNHHPIHWKEITVLDHYRRQLGAVGEGGSELSDDTLRGAPQQDRGLEVSGCWTTVMRRQGGRNNLH